VKKFPVFYATRRFITVFTRAHSYTLSTYECSSCSHPISVKTHIITVRPSTPFKKPLPFKVFHQNLGQDIIWDLRCLRRWKFWIVVFWVVTACSLVGICRRFGETYDLHFQFRLWLRSSERFVIIHEITQWQNPGALCVWQNWDKHCSPVQLLVGDVIKDP
jgi:hypothetical protein